MRKQRLLVAAIGIGLATSAEAVAIADGFVEVKFKPISGRTDQAGGIPLQGGNAERCAGVLSWGAFVG